MDIIKQLFEVKSIQFYNNANGDLSYVMDVSPLEHCPVAIDIVGGVFSENKEKLLNQPRILELTISKKFDDKSKAYVFDILDFTTKEHTGPMTITEHCVSCNSRMIDYHCKNAFCTSKPVGAVHRLILRAMFCESGYKIDSKTVNSQNVELFAKYYPEGSLQYISDIPLVLKRHQHNLRKYDWDEALKNISDSRSENLVELERKLVDYLENKNVNWGDFYYICFGANWPVIASEYNLTHTPPLETFIYDEEFLKDKPVIAVNKKNMIVLYEVLSKFFSVA